MNYFGPRSNLLGRISALGLPLALAAFSSAQVPDGLTVGHWVRAKGLMGSDGRMQAAKLEVLPPEEENTLIGKVERLREDRLIVLGQLVHLSNKTRGLAEADFGDPEARFKIVGHYRGPEKFSARSLVGYRSQYDQLEARIDAIEERDGGLVLSMLKYEVFVPASVQLKSKQPLAEFELAPYRQLTSQVRDRDEDDDIGSFHMIGEDLRVGARLTFKSRHEEDYDLDKSVEADRRDDEASLRVEAIYQPSSSFYGLLGYRNSRRWRADQVDGNDVLGSGKISEAYGYWSDLLLDGVDLQIGRQDFDEKREWLYDQNLDAARVIYRRGDLRAEFSASTTLSDGGPRDENTDNLIAYVTHGPPSRQLAAYIIDRRDNRGTRDYPLHYGARALGEWIPDQDIWAEVSGLTGYEGFDDLRSLGVDVGSTWEPSFAGEYYFSAGFAWGSGDDDPTDGVDRNYRQTGLQDNNDKLGGVTSFRYYGELVDPELSNLSILTLGVGRRFGNKNSLDLLYHKYAQDQADDFMLNADLNRKPDGIHTDLGWELDLVYGTRALADFDIKVVASMFQPGEAFAIQDPAYMANLRIRFKF